MPIRITGILCSQLLSGIFVFSVGGSLPLPGPSGQASGAEFEEDHFGIDVLLESWEKSTETGTSVDQPEPEPGHVPPAIQPPRVVPYPYQLDEVIGGDSVQSIQQRLLAKYSYTPPIGIMYLAEIEAKDLFEVKVEILRIMAVLDPTGDWLGRGARALENPRTATGEHSLDKLHTLLKNLYWSYSYCAPCEHVWIREGNRSDVPLTQPGNGPEGTAAWGMSASRRKAHFSLWVIRRAALSDQGPGHKGPGTIQERRTPEVTAMSRNLTHGPKRRANTRT
ncbi:hypothetical protein KY285_024334 [Solanum tuberosum]|nr:hypothetical protein KY285_024334 [Solanum tuberosum]